MCLFKIILKERNRKGENFAKFITERLSKIGYKDHLQVILSEK